MALAIQMVSVSECLAMAEKLGLDPQIMASIMVNATSRCWSIDTYSPLPGFLPKTVPADNDYKGGFSNELLVSNTTYNKVKDLTIAIESSKSSGSKTELGDKVFEIYKKLIEQGLAKKDFGVIYKELSK